jgi:uncharacterized protein
VPRRARVESSVPRLTAEPREVSVRGDGGLRIAVVADTHSRPHGGASGLIAKLTPDLILHAGDIGSLQVLDDLATLAPLVAVRGNIDAHTPGIPDAIHLDVRAGEDSLFRLLLVHIAVAGPRLRADAAKLAHAGGASLVVCGHSHVPFIGRDRGLVVFNPGSIGPRRFDLPIAMGVIELRGGALDLYHLDVETGVRWSPGPAASHAEP